ncbi:hypothetical protein BDN67DRAFT_970768 [Paxillus ammoniavirescens]|nr:hypothetical protein BDN67DRAFT_970768 [Paxillus ammoniavirescens]
MMRFAFTLSLFALLASNSVVALPAAAARASPAAPGPGTIFERRSPASDCLPEYIGECISPYRRSQTGQLIDSGQSKLV